MKKKEGRKEYSVREKFSHLSVMKPPIGIYRTATTSSVRHLLSVIVETRSNAVSSVAPGHFPRTRCDCCLGAPRREKGLPVTEVRLPVREDTMDGGRVKAHHRKYMTRHAFTGRGRDDTIMKEEHGEIGYRCYGGC